MLVWMICLYTSMSLTVYWDLQWNLTNKLICLEAQIIYKKIYRQVDEISMISNSQLFLLFEIELRCYGMSFWLKLICLAHYRYLKISSPVFKI